MNYNINKIGTYTLSGAKEIIFEENDQITALSIKCDTVTSAILLGNKTFSNKGTNQNSNSTELKQDEEFVYNSNKNIEYLKITIPLGCTVRITAF